VERLGGILQATLTLNGLIGGVTLGLFSLGIFCKSANTKGALYGGLLSLCIVIYVGIMAQLVNDEPEKLPTSTDECHCQGNNTQYSPTMRPDDNDVAFPTTIYRMSYMWYSLVGAVLTMVFGLIISLATDELAKLQIRQLTQRKSAGASPSIASLENGNGKLKTQNNWKNSAAVDIILHHQANYNSSGILTIGEHNQPHRRISKVGIDNPTLVVDEIDDRPHTL
jgi:Na+/proline symporter